MPRILPRSLTTALLLLAFASTVAACGRSAAGAPDQFSQSGELIAFSGGDAGPAGACVTCHRLHGVGDGELAPRLAGLPRGYLQKQLEDYAAGLRPHDQMTRIAKALSQEDRALVARYYAAAVGRPDSARASGVTSAAGARLYEGGDPVRGLPGCAQCHGSAGEGRGEANPPLAGQSAAYLGEQLTRWKTGERRNDPGGVMLRISQQLSDREIAEVSKYAANLALPLAPPVERLEPFPRIRRPDR